MQESAVELLVCPACKRKLQLEIFKTARKKFKMGTKTIVESGILSCSCSFLFPIVDTVPRMLIESFEDCENFLSRNVRDFLEIKHAITSKYNLIIQEAKKRNRRTKRSFSLEWSLLKVKNGAKIWRLSDEEYKDQLFNELKLPKKYFENKFAIDVGCGHGRSTALLGEICKVAVGMDLGLSVINASAENESESCHFIQGDLHCPPFRNDSFDIVYSSGVLHHTYNTENAFNIVSRLVKKQGVCCVWLYKPYNSRAHKTIINFRKITTRLPLKFQFWLYLLFLVPTHKLIAWARHRKPKPWREIMIELLDTFSPLYRFEHEPEEVKLWFAKNDFIDIEVSTVSDIGFSITGQKKT